MEAIVDALGFQNLVVTISVRDVMSRRREKRRIADGGLPPGAVVAGMSQQDHASPYGSEKKFYVGIHFQCKDCEVDDMWTGTQKNGSTMLSIPSPIQRSARFASQLNGRRRKNGTRWIMFVPAIKLTRRSISRSRRWQHPIPLALSICCQLGSQKFRQRRACRAAPDDHRW